MNIQAIWENGVLRPLQPLHLKHDKVVIQVPDEEIESPNLFHLSPEIYKCAQSMREKFDAILNAPLPPDDELPELTEKQMERIAAFELREDH